LDCRKQRAFLAYPPTSEKKKRTVFGLPSHMGEPIKMHLFERCVRRSEIISVNIRANPRPGFIVKNGNAGLQKA
jgi:hypothetical protein